MEGSTRASDASVIPPKSIQIPDNISDADDTRAKQQKGSSKPMVQYVVGLAPTKTEPMNTEPTDSQLATAKSILDQIALTQMATGQPQTTPAEQFQGEPGTEPAPPKTRKKKEKKEKVEVESTTCDLCGVILNSDGIAQTHYAGKKHQKKLKAETVLKDW